MIAVRQVCNSRISSEGNAVIIIWPVFSLSHVKMSAVQPEVLLIIKAHFVSLLFVWQVLLLAVPDESSSEKCVGMSGLGLSESSLTLSF